MSYPAFAYHFHHASAASPPVTLIWSSVISCSVLEFVFNRDSTSENQITDDNSLFHPIGAREDRTRSRMATEFTSRRLTASLLATSVLECPLSTNVGASAGFDKALQNTRR